MFEPFSFFSEARWPAVPSPYAGGVLAMLFQLEQTQWLSPEEIVKRQLEQLQVVIDHARATVPFYRDRLGKISSLADLRQLPLLTRRDVQLAGAELHSTAIPKNHGDISTTTTGGSTGQPVKVLGTDFTEFIWRVLTLRDHLWHGRDFSKSFAAIRYTPDNVGRPPVGTRLDTWGASTKNVLRTGTACVLNVKSSIEEQANWLRHVNPGYALAYPSALVEIARIFEKQGWSLPHLHQTLTYGEVLDPECRAICERVFGVPVVDAYSSQEVGYLALQCPSGNSYHIQAESVLVEVIDDVGKPCELGEVGKVVVSTLHNFAMPLIRYDIGDFAEVGQCDCGRGLPALRRILGRKRNLLRMPDGTHRWPVFVSLDGDDELPPFFQFQVVQKSIEQLEINVVRPMEVTDEETALVRRHFQRVLGHPFQVQVNRVSEIARSPSGKFEDFISLVE
jgi:phenylacetate-CoA ligase